jgi:uncharacterized FlaG/YvyC family protein
MKTYKTPNTDKFPFRYTVESNAYIVHTCNEDKYNELVRQIAEKEIIEFSAIQITKLQMAGFTAMKKG